MGIEITYIGHSAFYIYNEKTGILIDPFISQNPVANFDYKKYRISQIFVTHAHADHLGDAIEISKETGASIVCVFELAQYCAKKGANVLPVNIGGEILFDWGCALFVPAYHSSSTADGVYGGMSAGIIISIDGAKIYHAGDTSLSMEMQLIGDIYKPQLAMLPIGGCFTMGINDAVVAARLIKAEHIIPMHYNTFEQIYADAEQFKKLIEAQGQKCIVMPCHKEPN